MMRRSRRPIEASIRTPTSDPGEVQDAGLREALSHWASGVAILAVSDGEEIDAITISAFSALSLSPPLVLSAIGEQSSILPMLREEARFTLSILSEDQQAIAGAVAQRLPGSDRIFTGLEDPSVRESLVVLRCTLWNDYDGGDHRIIVGRVEETVLGPDAGPLLHYRRDYRTLR